ncbi:MAG: Cache 3/Cache 2 fusion domain-containing protein, partial [Lachnospiraceae bacterium]|nr:Cache 3/Cache 2 fusion domain-containing protein [Lachnospiraceae bacterium]
VNQSEAYLVDYAQASELLRLFENPGSETAARELQEYTERYAAVGENLENIYASDWNSTVVASRAQHMIGVTLRQGESLAQLQAGLSRGMHNAGIMASQASGLQVISLCYPVKNADGVPVGYVGAAIYASGLRDNLNELYGETSGNQYMLLDAAAGLYIFCPQDELIGTAIEDEDHLEILRRAKGAKGASSYEFKDTESGREMISVMHYMEDRDWVFVVLTDRADAFAPISRLLGMVVLLSLLVLVVVSAVVWVCVAALAKDIHREAEIIQELGKLDFTKKEKLGIFIGRGDEVGMIAGATKALVDSIHTVLLKLREQSGELQRTSREMSDNSNSTSNTLRSVESAIQEISSGALSQASETEKASESVVRIGDQIKEAKSRSTELDAVAARISISGNQALGTLQTLVEINRRARAAIEKINEQTISTNESVLKIKDAAELITSIAEETNLLSLNASIEAARAGDQGRGFAVVADQIKKLAEQSNSSAQFIDNIIISLLEESSEAVKVMDDVREIMEQQSGHLTMTEDRFNEVNRDIEITKNGISGISSSITNTDSEREGVVDAVQSLTAIAQENAAGTEESLASIGMVNTMVQDVAEAANQLAQLSDTIDQNIRIFTV